MTAPNPEGDVVLRLLKEAGHVCDTHVRCPVRVVRPVQVDPAPGPSCGPPPYCILETGHEGPHRSQHGGALRGETEEVVLPQRCLKCRQPWPCKTATAALQPSPVATEGVREKVARAICDFEWDGSQPSFDRKPPAFHARYLAWADAVLAALPPVSGGGGGAVAPLLPTEGQDGAVVGDKTFVLSALVSKQEPGLSLASMVMGLRRCPTLDEATGSFIASVRSEKVGFSIDEILSMELEGDARQQAAPGRERGE